MANGIIVIDKPQEWTSMDVCAKIRGVLHERRVGHAGTLDPMATGVLPILLGRAAKALNFLPDTDKEYVASFRLGERRDTGDITGQVVEETFKVMLNGKVTDSTITITIRGTNDAPVITSEAKDLSLKVQEDAEEGLQPMEGTLKAEDIDYILDGNGNPALDGNGDARTETETLEWFFRDKDGNLVKELETEYGKVTLKVDEGGRVYIRLHAQCGSSDRRGNASRFVHRHRA